MNSIRTIFFEDYPKLLQEIPNPPKEMYIRGDMPSEENIFLTVVGSRKFSDYGRQITEKLIESLRGFPVVIVSGLAYGIDSIAHETALKNGIKTIAVPGSGIDDDSIYPARHLYLAHKILENGGAIMSPFKETVMGNDWTFPARNRIMAGMSHATLVIEANIKSGTLITSKFATDFNRDVLTVPGSIFSKQSAGPHMLIRLGATPITCSKDLIEALGFKTDIKREKINYSNLSPEEIKIIEILVTPMSRDKLFEKLKMDTGKISTIISMLEIKGVIEEKFGEFRNV